MKIRENSTKGMHAWFILIPPPVGFDFADKFRSGYAAAPHLLPAGPRRRLPEEPGAPVARAEAREGGGGAPGRRAGGGAGPHGAGPRGAEQALVAESGRRLTRSKLLARRPHSGGHWPGKKLNNVEEDLRKTLGRPRTFSAAFWKKINPEKFWSKFSKKSAKSRQNLRTYC